MGKRHVTVTEIFQGETVWEVVVAECSKKRRFVAVLHQGPVDSPETAVRAAIVERYRN